VDSAFNNLNVPRDLACDFLGVFARSEYALKASGFADDKGNRVDVGWDKFAKAIADGFDLSENQDLRTAVDYLLANPPKKQFHGGKFLSGPVSDPDRDRLLVQHSLTVLRTCVSRHNQVAASYAQRA
jgi:hypothetical protein